MLLADDWHTPQRILEQHMTPADVEEVYAARRIRQAWLDEARDGPAPDDDDAPAMVDAAGNPVEGAEREQRQADGQGGWESWGQ